MESKMRSEKSGSENLDLVIESISEDLKSNLEETANLVNVVENLKANISDILENQRSISSKNDSEIKSIINEFQKVRDHLMSISFPEKSINDLSARISSNSLLLKHPVEARILHQHHFPKISWIAAGLWVVLSLSIAGLYVTNSKLNAYIANDTKFRHLRLDTANKRLQIALEREDSLYYSNPDFRKIVIKTEENYLHDFERLRKADRLKAEAKDLERKVKEK
jgi:hypothetical protein